MKMIAKFMIIVIISMSLTACGNTQVIEGTLVDTHGVFTMNQAYEDVEYQIIVGNVIWAIILFETLVAPIYFIGFSLWEPVGKLKDGKKLLSN